MMGTSVQTLTSTSRRSETLDTSAGRDTAPCSSGPLRQGRLYNGAGPPPALRPHSRPVSSAVGDALSPRQHHSYRDAALVATQYGLSAYAPSATAAAAAVRHSAARASGGGSVSSQSGRPPPPPLPQRPSQHSAPTPHYTQPLEPDRLPSRCGPPPSRGGPPASRGGPPPAGPAGLSQGRCGQLHSRGGARPPSGAGAFASRPQHHRISESEPLPPAYSDAWRGHLADQPLPHDHDDFVPTGSGLLPTALSSGSVRGMSSGWGAAGPSAYEADGRPGTRGGGPQYDMDGRPTTRGGQRPPSRVQLGLVQHQRPPTHVPPLAGGGWASMFAGGPGPGPGTSLGGGMGRDPSPNSTLSSSGGLGASGHRSSGDGYYDPASSLRRQPLPMPPAMSGSGSGGVSGNAAIPASFSPPLGTSVAGVLSSLGHAQPPGQGAGYHASYHASAHAAQLANAAAAAAAGGASARLASKLSSIAEVPSALQSPKGSFSRLESISFSGASGGGGGRKASRERDRDPLMSSILSSVPDSMDGASLDGLSDEGIATLNDLTFLSNLDQDPGGSRGAARSRRSVPSSEQRALGGGGDASDSSSHVAEARAAT